MYQKDGFSSLNEIPVIGEVHVNNISRNTNWSLKLYDFLEMAPEKLELNNDSFLSFVIDDDKGIVRKMLTEDFDTLKNESHFICKIKKQETLKTILGIRRMVTEESKPAIFNIAFFDISELAKHTESPKIPNHERSLDLSTTWLNHIFENKAAGIFILNEKGQFLKANQTYQGLTEYKEKDLKKLTFLNVTLKDDWDICTEHMEKLISGEVESVNFEKRILTKSKKLLWVEVSCSIVKQDKSYVLCFLTDIHEKKLAQEKLRTSEEQLHQAQEVAKIGSWGMDLNTQVITWSRGMYDLMELPYDYHPTKDSALNLIHPEDRGLFIERLSSMEEIKDLEIRHLTASGIKHILINSRIDYEDGAPIRYHGTSQDISERNFFDERLELVQKTAKLGWWEANMVTGKDVWSDTMYEMLGLDKNTAIPCFESFLHTMHPEDEHFVRGNVNDPEILKNGWHNLETRHKGADGTYKYFLSSGNFIWDGDRPVKLIGTMMDISTAKETQTRLEEAQKIAKLGSWEANLITGESVWSDSMYELYELDKNTTTPGFEAYLKTIHPDDIEMVMAYMSNPEVLRTGWYNEEMRHVMPDGTSKHFLVSGNPIMDGDRLVKLVGTNMDITPLKKTQLRLEQAQRIAKLGWWEFDLTGEGNHWYSTEHMEIFGISSAKEISNYDDFLSFVHPEDVPLAVEAYQNASKKNGWNNLVHRIKKKNGGYKYITSNATIEFHDEKPVRLIGSVYDVSDFKEIEMELAKNLVNLEAMVTTMENIVFVIDNDYKFREVFCNDPRKLHIRASEFIGKNVGEIWKEENEIHGRITLKKCKEALENDVLDPIAYKYAPHDQEYWWEAKFKPFVGQNGEKWLTVIINEITSKKNAEEELIKGVQKEKELSEMRSQFVSMASHQFRTPLTVIKSNMQLLELAEIKHPVVEKVTRRLQSEVDRLVNLMDDILAMGKVQSNAVQPNFKYTDLLSLVTQIKLNIENQQNDGRSLIIAVSGKRSLLKLDTQFIEHALNNLVENAFKYSTGRPNPEIKLNYGKDKLRISVIDHGIGIPKEDRAKLFSPFQRGSNSQHIPGTGLGLAVTKEFVQLNHGTIFLNAKRKSGTEFCIDLPFND